MFEQDTQCSLLVCVYGYVCTYIPTSREIKLKGIQFVQIKKKGQACAQLDRVSFRFCSEVLELLGSGPA